MSRKMTKNIRCEKCGKLAKHEVKELKEGPPDRGWITYEVVTTHFYCTTHRPELAIDAEGCQE
jgi:hypothetical protein